MKGGQFLCHLDSECIRIFYSLMILPSGSITSERSPQFIVQAYLTGPQNVNLKETGPSWLKFEEAISHYEDLSK